MTPNLFTAHDALTDWQADLTRLKDQARWRHIRTPSATQGPFLWQDGHRLVNFSGNDYLGLAGDTQIAHQLSRHLDTLVQNQSLPLWGSTASRLMAGASPWHAQLESTLATLYPGRQTLLFNSGWHANTALLAALAAPGDAIFADRLIHASLIDGWRLSGARLHRYRHADASHLEDMLKRHRGQYKRAFVVTESLFSMDGDEADLSALVELKNRHEAFLVVDEAHAFGVLGPRGAGVAARDGLANQVDIVVGTFGKALASVGAFVAADPVVIEYLIQKSRPLIFSTALPPACAVVTLFHLSLEPDLARRRTELSRLAREFHAQAQSKGWMIPGHSWIVPLMLGSDVRAVQAANRCVEAGLSVLPIRPPTVPEGSARLRLSLRADMSPEMWAPLWTTLEGLS
ncbi:MAG: 8-amino-7-oxononanoate synthase [Spirochaetales bacterium]|nr:8-amino-7-oxononanoate synthase [Spirochaetales bacterium]